METSEEIGSESVHEIRANRRVPLTSRAVAIRERAKFRVLKFGGTSVARPDAMRAAVGRVAVALDEARGARIVVVVSAVGGVTDRLVSLHDRALRGEVEAADFTSLRRLHRDLLEEVAADQVAGTGDEIDRRLVALERHLSRIAASSDRTDSADSGAARDLALACGERLSAPIFCAALNSVGIGAQVVDAAELLLTDGNYGDAEVDVEASAERALDRLARLETRVVVVPGFFGVSRQGDVTLLGRGGSDTAATALAAALGAERVDIWTDVDGVYSADPRMVPAARRLLRVRRDEAADLAFFGAKVLHHKCLAPLEQAARRGRPIAVCVAATHDSAGGTWIDEPAAKSTRSAGGGAKSAGAQVRAVATQTRLASVSLAVDGAGPLETLRALRRARTAIYHLAPSPCGSQIRLLVSEESARGDCAALLAAARATIQTGLALVAAVGPSIAWAGGRLADEFRRAVGAGVAPGSPAEFGEVFPNVLLAVVAQDQVAGVARAVHHRMIESVLIESVAAGVRR